MPTHMHHLQVVEFWRQSMSTIDRHRLKEFFFTNLGEMQHKCADKEQVCGTVSLAPSPTAFTPIPSIGAFNPTAAEVSDGTTFGSVHFIFYKAHTKTPLCEFLFFSQHQKCQFVTLLIELLRRSDKNSNVFHAIFPLSVRSSHLKISIAAIVDRVRIFCRPYPSTVSIAILKLNSNTGMK